MRIGHFKHNGVKPDGTFYDKEGAVYAVPHISVSNPDGGGCDLPECKNCSKEHYIAISFGRDEITESVSGITVYFDSYEEMQEALTFRMSSMEEYLLKSKP